MESIGQKVIYGDCLEVLKGLPECSVDAVVTDPPYELGFMGKKWDNTGIAYNVELWSECLRVLKPGGHLLAFSGTRTYHRMAVAIEDAGFEIRDMLSEVFDSNKRLQELYNSLDYEQIKLLEDCLGGLGMMNWCYASGFPKSQNIGKMYDKMHKNEREVIGKQPIGYSGLKRNANLTDDNWKGITAEDTGLEITKGTSPYEGFGSALKPAHEPIVMARKPLSEKTIVDNVVKWGTGGIQIDGCRIPISEEEKYTDEEWKNLYGGNRKESSTNIGNEIKNIDRNLLPNAPTGRFPANILCTDDALNDGVMTRGCVSHSHNKNVSYFGNNLEKQKCINPQETSGSKSRYFDIDVWGEKHGLLQFPKASKAERNDGLNNTENLWLNKLELIAESCIFTVQNLFIQQWEKQDQNQSTDFNGEAQQHRDISEVMIAEVGDSEWNTISCGKKQMAIFPKAIKFTTLTESSQIIELKTLNYYQHLTTSECIADAIKTAMDNGLSLAENVGLKNLLKLIFTKDDMGFPLGVKVVAKKTPQSISVKERLKLSNIHSTVKPVHLMAWLVRLVSKENDTVLDPFGGSGTTAVACIKLKRNFILIEREAEYIEIIKARVNKANQDSSLTLF